MLYIVAWFDIIGLVLGIFLSLLILGVGRNEGSRKREVALTCCVATCFLIILYSVWNYMFHSTYNYPFWPNAPLQNTNEGYFCPITTYNVETIINGIWNVEFFVNWLIQAMIFLVLFASTSLIMEHDTIPAMFCGIAWSISALIVAAYYAFYLFFRLISQGLYNSYPSYTLTLVTIVHFICVIQATIQFLAYRHNSKRYAKILCISALCVGWTNSISWIIWNSIVQYFHNNSYIVDLETLMSWYVIYELFQFFTILLIWLIIIFCLYLPEAAFEKNNRTIIVQKRTTSSSFSIFNRK